MTERAVGHAALVYRWYEDLFNARRLVALEEIVTVDCILHLPDGDTALDPRAIRAGIEAYHAAFIDARWTIHDIIVAQDRITVRASGESRYIGGWHSIPGSGQPITETCINIFRIAGDQIAEVWFEVSDLDVARQLGVFPPS